MTAIRNFINRIAWGLYQATKDEYGPAHTEVVVEVKGTELLKSLLANLKSVARYADKMLVLTADQFLAGTKSKVG